MEKLSGYAFNGDDIISWKSAVISGVSEQYFISTVPLDVADVKGRKNILRAVDALGTDSPEALRLM